MTDPRDRTAIVTTDGTFTYRELGEAAERVSAGLLVGRTSLDEARVAFLVPPSAAYVAVALGIWRAGGVAVPLAVPHPAAELEYVVADADASTVICEAARAHELEPIARVRGARFETAERLLSTAAGADTSDSASSSRSVGSASLLDFPPAQRALLLYTSGTTSKPKGVVTTHANLSAQIASLVQAWEWTGTDRTLLVLPLHHVHGIVNVLGCALSTGATCEILPRFDAEATWSRLASGELTVFTAVPTIYHRLIQSWDASPPSVQQARSDGCRRLRLMMSGSAALPVQTLERWRAISSHTLLERYGMTETGMVLSNPLRGERRPGYVGTPLPGVSVRLVDDAGVEIAPDAPGELEVRGPGVFLEYWQRPSETQRAFREGWFRTGDVAVIEQGAYRLLGRTSVDIIKTGGYKVSALEIEEVIRVHPAVSDCAVVGIPDAAWGERVCVAVELRPDAVLSLEELQAWTKARLASYKVPKELHCVGSLPRNAMGKVVKPDVAKLLTHPSR